jgi:hypothetical protein
MEILLPTSENYCILWCLFYLENTNNAYLKDTSFLSSLLLENHITSFFYGDFNKKHSNIRRL